SLMMRKQALAQGFARWFSGRRQVVESVFARLPGLFAVNRPRSKGMLGWWVRLSAKVAAYHLLLRLNAAWGRPLESHLDLLALP
ncbi:hypothetical protein, partial [Deinococcus frigens]|uniref:hypothetical protein n=1 Tax=Deinococcus frigens TaxID=249403 RepID=UPI000496513D